MKILLIILTGLIYTTVPAVRINSATAVASPAKATHIYISDNKKPLAQPTIPVTPVTSTPQYTSSPAVYSTPVQKSVIEPASTPVTNTPISNTTPPVESTDKACAATNTCTDPNASYYDEYGNEYDYQGNIINYSPSCAPNATAQDPCKLGQCFGYPYGICESNPNQGEDGK